MTIGIVMSLPLQISTSKYDQDVIAPTPLLISRSQSSPPPDVALSSGLGNTVKVHSGNFALLAPVFCDFFTKGPPQFLNEIVLAASADTLEIFCVSLYSDNIPDVFGPISIQQSFAIHNLAFDLKSSTICSILGPVLS